MGGSRNRIFYLDSPQRRPVSIDWKAPGCRRRKGSAPGGTKFHLGSCRGWIARMSRCEYSGVEIAPRRTYHAVCFPRVYLNATRAAPSHVGEGEKQARKKARFNGRNEFPATWSAIASALFFAFRQHACIMSYNLRWFTLNNTDYVDLCISSHIQLLDFWSFMHVCTVATYTTKQETREKRGNQKKNTRNERLISFDCKMDIPRTVIEPCRECNGKPPDNGTRRESREEPRSALSIENTSSRRIICTSVNIDTLISTVIYYSERDVRDNILHAVTSYFMQKVVKRKRPRIVFDDSSAGCVLWEVTLAR